jgi:predicted metal-dependent hydrolase
MRHPVVLPPGPAYGTVWLGRRSVEYRVRRSPRSRGLRVTIDPRAGVVVSVPPASRRGWAAPEPRIEGFLRERAAWVLRHLDDLTRERESAIARGGAQDGGLVPYLGELHQLSVDPAAPAAPGAAVRNTSVRAGTHAQGPELRVEVAPGERRGLDRILAAWLREQAREAIDVAVARYAAELGVQPRRVDMRDPRSRWGSASRNGRLMFSWRLVLAPPASLETVVVHELAHLKVFGHGPAFWALVAARRPTHLADRAWLRRNSFALHAALDVPGA